MTPAEQRLVIAARAREQALREAADYHKTQEKRWRDKIEADSTGMNGVVYVVCGSLVAHHNASAEAILALITGEDVA